jgi:hypothetical protein
MNSPHPLFKILLLIAGLAGMLAMTPASRAALIAYEGFTNAPGDIIGMNGGIGWIEPWNTNVSPGGASEVVANSLSYTDSVGNILITAGNKFYNHGLSGAAQPGRLLSATQGSTNLLVNSTVWISFVGQRIGTPTGSGGPGGTPSYERGANLSLFDADISETVTNLLERLNVGENSGTSGNAALDVWHFTEPNPTYRAYSTNSITNQSLVVLRIDFFTNDFSSGIYTNDDLYMWINPQLGVEPSTNNVATNGIANGHDLSFNRLRFFAGAVNGASAAAEWYCDEIRIGDTYADVTPYTPGGGGPSTVRTNITTSVSGSTLTLSWPDSHKGWNLQTQTNSSSVGLTAPANTWHDVSGSAATNQVQMTINPANPTVFFRLRLAQ